MASFLDSFPFAIFVISILSTKFLHLYLHANSIPVFSFLLYLPSFFVPDVIFISIIRILLRRERSILSTIGYVLGLSLTYVQDLMSACPISRPLTSLPVSSP